MKTVKEKLPQQQTKQLYQFQKREAFGMDTPATSTHTDPTTACTTILTSTHFG